LPLRFFAPKTANHLGKLKALWDYFTDAQRQKNVLGFLWLISDAETKEIFQKTEKNFRKSGIFFEILFHFCGILFTI